MNLFDLTGAAEAEILRYATDFDTIKNAGELIAQLDRWMIQGVPTDGLELGTHEAWNITAHPVFAGTVTFHLVVASIASTALAVRVCVEHKKRKTNWKSEFQLAVRRLAYMHENK